MMGKKKKSCLVCFLLLRLNHTTVYDATPGLMLQKPPKFTSRLISANALLTNV